MFKKHIQCKNWILRERSKSRNRSGSRRCFKEFITNKRHKKNGQSFWERALKVSVSSKRWKNHRIYKENTLI